MNQPNYRPQQQQLPHQSMQASHPNQGGGQQSFGNATLQHQIQRGQPQNIPRQPRATPAYSIPANQMPQLHYATTMQPGGLYAVSAQGIRIPNAYSYSSSPHVNTVGQAQPASVIQASQAAAAAGYYAPATHYVMNGGHQPVAHGQHYVHHPYPSTGVRLTTIPYPYGGSQNVQMGHISQGAHVQGIQQPQQPAPQQQQQQQPQQQSQQVSHPGPPQTQLALQPQQNPQQVSQQHQVPTQQHSSIPSQHYTSRVEPTAIPQAHRGSSEGPQGQPSQGHTSAPSQVRSEVVQPTRKKRILQIIDPTSGKAVIESTDTKDASGEPGKEDEKSKQSDTTPEVSIMNTGGGAVELPATSSSTSSSTKALELQAPSPSAAVDDSSSKTKAKSEFFTRISQANDGSKDKKKTDEPSNKLGDEAPTAASTTTSSNIPATSSNTAGQLPASGTPSPIYTPPSSTPVPPAVTTTTSVSGERQSPDSISVEDKSEVVAATTTNIVPPEVESKNIKNKAGSAAVVSDVISSSSSPDETRETSPTLVVKEPIIEPSNNNGNNSVIKATTPPPSAVVPTAITANALSTPASTPPTTTTTTAPVVVEEEGLGGDFVVVEKPSVDDEKNISSSVDKLTNSLSELTTTTNGNKQDNEDDEDGEKNQVPDHDISTVSISPTPIEEYVKNSGDYDESLLDSSFQEEVNNENNLADVNDIAAEAEHLSGDDVDMEEGELQSSDKDDDAEQHDDASKQGFKYDRALLLKLRQSPASKVKRDIKIDDVLKDGKSNNSNSYNMNRTPPSHQSYGGRGIRGNPKDGNRMGIHPGPGGQHPGMMRGLMGSQWGQMGALGPLGQIVIPPPLRGPRPPIMLTTREKVELNKAENAWKPSRKDGRGGAAADSELTPDEIETQSIVKQVRGILNKLTPENLDKLSQKFLKLELNDRDDRISAVIDVVFEKAIDEPNFSTAYAKMVQFVCANSQETAKKFRKEILDQCQKEFQKTNKDEDEIKNSEAEILTAPEDKKEELRAELEEKRTQMRRRSLGNIRFIGELYKLQMLTPKIMVDCVIMLLGNQDEESYECLCKLLTTVGQKLDNQLKEQEARIKNAKQNNQPLPKFIPEEKFMDKTFDKLRKLSNDTAKLSSRIRFALLDVVELRQNDWKPRRDTNAPKTIEEVRRDAIRQDQEEKNKIDALPSAMGSRNRPPLGQQSMSSQPKKGNDWNTVGSISSNKSARFQTLGKKPTEQSQTTSPTLGPPTMGSSWNNTSSSRSSSNNSKLPPRLQQQQQQQNNSGFGQNSHHGHLPQHNMNRGYNSGGGGVISTPTNRFNMLQNIPAPSQPNIPQIPPSQQQYQQQSSPNIPDIQSLDTPTPEVNETVKNIFQEYLTVKKHDDTLHWIKDRFPGSKVQMFVDVLARQVGEMSKTEQQIGAGQLIKLLIKSDVIPRDHVLKVLTLGLIPDIPDIQVDCPKVLTYVGVFVLEVFGDEQNLNWLIELTKPLKGEDFESTLEEFIRETLSLFKDKKTEEYVKSLWKKTNDKGSIPEESLPWSNINITTEMVKVLKNHENLKDIFEIFKENSWDLRELDIKKAAMEATFEVCLVGGKFDESLLNRCLSLFENKSLKTTFPDLWKWISKELLPRYKVSKDEEDFLWKSLNR